MKDGAMRLTATVMLALVLFTGLLPGKMGKQEDAGITLQASYDLEEIYVYVRSANARRQPDGTHLVEVEFTTDMNGSLVDMREVTVFCGEQQAGFALTEDNLGDVHKVCILATEQPETVRIEVRAHQTEAGLLLISDGAGQLCGQATAPVDGERMVYLSGASPFGSYRVYRIAELSELFSGMVVLSSKPTVKELEEYAVPSCYATTLTAEADGTAFCNFTREGLVDGLYLVEGEGGPVYICVPRLEASGAFVSSVVQICMDRIMQQYAQNRENYIE